MRKPTITGVPYNERTDDQKLESNWYKAGKLFERNDWSAAVIRVATSVEIAANIYVRQFLIGEYNLPSSYVDALLRSANGLDGKFNRLIRPAAEHKGTWDVVKAIKSKIEALNEHRNSVAHSGSFKNEDDARAAFAHGLAIVQVLAPNEAQKLELPA